MDDNKYLICKLGSIEMALSNVVQIVTEGIVQRVPNSPKGICGILYMNNSVIPIQDVTKGITEPSAIQVVVEKANELFAYTVDSVGEFAVISQTMPRESNENGVYVIVEERKLLIL